MLNKWPNARIIKEAHARIRENIHHTPVLTSRSTDNLVGAHLFFKCENFQKVGAFKIRGATNTIKSLKEDEIKGGVATHSSGNHAQAVALAARTRKVKAYIVMPENSPNVKVDAVKSYGAEITFCTPTQEAREKSLKKIISKTGATFIHPYNDYRVIAGQATAAKELFEEVSNLDAVMAPVGGGGLLSGTSLAAHYFSKNTKIYGAEPSGADDAKRSLAEDKIVPSTDPDTIADGLLTSLGDKTFPIIKEFAKDILVVADPQIVDAMRWTWERMKIIIDPSSAVAVAAVFNYPDKFAGRRVGIILSGGNVDLEKLPFQNL